METLPLTTPKTGPGPVYQGVAKQIRALERDETIDRDRDAGLIAQARSLARSLDLASGHGGRKPQGGMQLAALSAELRAVLEVLVGVDTPDDDPLAQLAASFQQLDHDSTSTPHPA